MLTGVLGTVLRASWYDLIYEVGTIEVGTIIPNLQLRKWRLQKASSQGQVPQLVNEELGGPTLRWASLGTDCHLQSIGGREGGLLFSPTFPSPPLLPLLKDTSPVPTAKAALSPLQKTSKLPGPDPAAPHEPSILRGRLPNRVIIVPLKLMSMKWAVKSVQIKMGVGGRELFNLNPKGFLNRHCIFILGTLPWAMDQVPSAKTRGD